MIARYINDDIYAQCRVYADRLVPMATLPLQNIELAIKVGTRARRSRRPRTMTAHEAELAARKHIAANKRMQHASRRRRVATAKRRAAAPPGALSAIAVTRHALARGCQPAKRKLLD